MKFSTFALTLLLLPLGILGSPVQESSRALSGEELFKRGTICNIVNVSTYVNCRSGPSTAYSVVETLSAGSSAWFGCYAFGECIEDNCTWDMVQWSDANGDILGCYISGYYTDDSCTMETLPRC